MSRFKIQSNQYMPKGVTKTYYYIVNDLGEIYHHSDGKFRKKSLMEMTTYKYVTEEQAQEDVDVLNKKEGKITTKMKENKTNEVIINAADFKFVDFSNSVISRSSRDFQDENWFVKLRELDAKIHSANMSDKINLTDDRLVLSAYKILVDTEVFTDNPSLREWWILKRYCEIYLPEKIELKDELSALINMYIGFSFSNATMDEEQKEKSEKYIIALRSQIFEDDYLVKFPQFFLNIVEGKKVKVKKVVTQYDFTNDEAAQWLSLKETATIMLDDKDAMTKEEIKMWEEALDVAIVMLDV